MGDNLTGPRVGDLNRQPLMAIERVAEGRADRLIDRALRTHFPAEADLGEIGVVNVAAEPDDRRRRTAACAGGDLDQDLLQPLEREVERGPVLEVERAPELLAPAGRPPPPR